MKEIKSDIGIDKYTDSLVSKTLKKGDYFIEIIYSPQGQNALSIVTEGKNGENNHMIREFAPISAEYITIENSSKKSQSKTNNITLFEISFPGVFGGASPTTVRGGTPWVKNGLPVTYGKYDYKSNSKDPNLASDDEPYDKHDKNNEKDPFKSKFEKPPDPLNEKNVVLRDIFLAFHDPKYIIRLETERFRTCLGYLVFP